MASLFRLFEARRFQSRIEHNQDSSHDGMQLAMIAVSSRRQWGDAEAAIGYRAVPRSIETRTLRPSGNHRGGRYGETPLD